MHIDSLSDKRYRLTIAHIFLIVYLLLHLQVENMSTDGCECVKIYTLSLFVYQLLTCEVIIQKSQLCTARPQCT